jgi:DNA-binding GntR family transcriptional regulator
MQYRTRAQIVVDALRKEMLSGGLEPGQDLSQDDLAARYGVSRIPVREALRSLAAEGLVELRPHRAPRVKLHSPEEIAELWWIRQILEPAAARLAAVRTTAALVSAAERVLGKMEKLGPLPDAGRWLALNRTFHLGIYSAAGRPQLQALITELLDQSVRYIGVYLKSPEQFHDAGAEHRVILAAFAAGDADRLERLTWEHLERVRTALKERFGQVERGGSV